MVIVGITNGVNRNHQKYKNIERFIYIRVLHIFYEHNIQYNYTNGLVYAPRPKSILNEMSVIMY